MAFLVEDGTGLAGSNSYCSVAEFEEHHTDRAQIDSGTEFTDAEIQAGLVNATDYIDKRFGRRFRGWRRKRTQALEWPRTNAFDDDDYLFPDLPTQLKKATNEYGLIVLRLARNLAPIPTPGYPIIDPTTGAVVDSASGAVTAKSEKVGPIEESTSYASTDSTGHPMTTTGNLTQRIPEYPQADLWIEEILESTGDRELARG
jgi:Putative DnaT-like ssDNA binding protein